MTSGEVAALIDRYDAAWNAQDLDTIAALHDDAIVFHNHTAGERVAGAPAVRAHIGAIFARWPHPAEPPMIPGEIIVADDLAVVRLTWKLTVALPNGQTVTSREPGMDVLRKSPDGQWIIVRYIAYEAPERPTSSGQ